jgi:hypothetical protein
MANFIKTEINVSGDDFVKVFTKARVMANVIMKFKDSISHNK